MERTGVEWSHYKHPLPEYVYDVYHAILGGHKPFDELIEIDIFYILILTGKFL